MTNPWKDIASYKREDADNFKGRTDDIKKFSKIIQQSDFSVIYAESGIGKTSFLNAGIIPLFEKHNYYFINIEFPKEVLSGDNTEELKSRLESWLCNKVLDTSGLKRVRTELDELPSGIEEKFKNCLWWQLHTYKYEAIINGEKSIVTPVILFDQFEEVFQKAESDLLHELFSILENCSSRIPPQNIIEELYELEKSGAYITIYPDINYKMIFSLRKEYLAEFDHWTNDIYTIPELLQNRMILLPFTKEQAEEVITQQEVDGKVVDTLTDVKDDILKLFENKSNNSKNYLQYKERYEAFLLSVICSRLFEIASQNEYRKLTADDIKSLDINAVIYTFYKETINSLQISNKHLAIIESELVDESGERNRIKDNSSKLQAIRFAARYKDALEDKHIIRLSDGYVELIHDRVAEAIHKKRNEINQKRWYVMQRIVLALLVILAVCAAFWQGWSTSGRTSYDTREIIADEWVYEKADEIPYSATALNVDVDKLVSSIVDIKNRNFLQSINVNTGISKRVSIDIENCSRLTSLSLSNSIEQLGLEITNCPNLRKIRLPENLNNWKYPYDESSTPIKLDSLEFEVPEEIKDKFVWENGILWDIKKSRIIYAQSKADTHTYFPAQLKDKDTIKYNNVCYTRADESTPIIDIEGTTIVRARMYKNSSYEVPDSITSIADGAFANNESLQHITLPQNLKKIGRKAFMGCSALTRVTLPDSLDVIDDMAFADCISLESVEFPDSLKTLGELAFANCRSLKEVSMPIYIGTWDIKTFIRCKSLSKVILPVKTMDLIQSVSVTRKKQYRGIYFYSQFDDCDNLALFEIRESSDFSKRNGVVFYEDSPCFAETVFNYNDEFYETKDGVLYARNYYYPYALIATSKCENLSSSILNPDSVEYILGNRLLTNTENLKILHSYNTQPMSLYRFTDYEKANIILYVPWGCSKYYKGHPDFNAFKEIREDPWYFRIRGLLIEMWDMSLGTVIIYPVLKWALAFIVICFIMVVFYFRRKYIISQESSNKSIAIIDLKALSSTFFAIVIFALTWMSIYWLIFFAAEDAERGGKLIWAIGLIVGLFCAIVTAWFLVFSRNGNILTTLKRVPRKIALYITSATASDLFVDIKSVLGSLWRNYKRHYIYYTSVCCILLGAIMYVANYVAWDKFIKQGMTIIKNRSDYNLTTLKREKPAVRIFLTKSQKEQLRDIYATRLKVRDVHTYAEEFNTAHEYAMSLLSNVTFTPSGNRFVSYNDHQANVWDLNTMRVIATLGGYHDRVYVESNDKIVTQDDNQISLWDIETGDLLKTYSFEQDVGQEVFSPDSEKVAFESGKNFVLLNTKSGEIITSQKFDGSIGNIKYSSDGATITVDILWYGNDIYLDSNTGEIISAPKKTNSHSPNRKITARKDGRMLHLYNSETGEIIKTHEFLTIYDVAYSPDGEKIGVVAGNNIILLNTATGDIDKTHYLNMSSTDSDFRFSPDGKVGFVRIYDNVILLDTESGEIIKRQTFEYNIERITFSPDGTKVAFNSNRRNFILLNAKTGEITQHKFDDYISDITFSPNSETVAFESGNNFVLLNAKTGEIIKTQKAASYINGIEFSSNGKGVMFSDSHKNIINTETGELIRGGKSKSYKHVACNPKGNQLSATTSDSLIIFNRVRGEWRQTLSKSMEYATERVCYSRDGKLIFVQQSNDVMVMYDANNCDSIRSFNLNGAHTGDIEYVDINHDNRVLATSGDEGTIALWNIETGDTIRCIKGEADDYKIGFNRDNTITVKEKDNIARILNIETLDTIKVLNNINKIFTTSDDVVYQDEIGPIINRDGDAITASFIFDKVDGTISSYIYANEWKTKESLLISTIDAFSDNVIFGPDNKTLFVIEDGNIREIRPLTIKELEEKIKSVLNAVDFRN